METVNKFTIKCNVNPDHSTHLHFNPDKGYYAFICTDCGNTEVFDLDSNPINLKEEK